jgi:hypothetical protein
VKSVPWFELWAEFDTAKALSAATEKKWKPYFAQLIKRVGTDDMTVSPNNKGDVWDSTMTQL